MVARGSTDTVVASVTTTPAIAEMTHLSATRHWQDNGKTFIRFSIIFYTLQYLEAEYKRYTVYCLTDSFM